MRLRNPFLYLKEIADEKIRRNFENLDAYFAENNQLVEFKPLEFQTTAAETNKKVAHGLSVIPKDLVRLKIVGEGKVTFNYSRFTTETIDVTTTGAVRVRCLVGSAPLAGITNEGASLTESWQADVADLTNLLSQVTTALANASAALAAIAPTGGLMMYGGGAVPTGWLLCDGSAVSRVTYSALFAIIGTYFGSGDGLSTFNLPDFRNVFPRGVNSSTRTISGILYPAVTLGTTTLDKFQGHWHQHYYQASQNVAGGAFNERTASTTVDTLDSFQPTRNPTSDGTNGTPRTGTETAPVNLGVHFIIKT